MKKNFLLKFFQNDSDNINQQEYKSFIEQGYEIQKQCNITITSCVNYTYYILYKKENKDLILVEHMYSCHALNTLHPEVIHLEKIYEALLKETNYIEKITHQSYDTNNAHSSYKTKEYYEELKKSSIKWHQDKVDTLQEFINTYLDLLKNRYKD